MDHTMDVAPPMGTIEERLMWLALAWKFDLDWKRWCSRARPSWPDEPLRWAGWLSQRQVMRITGSTADEFERAAASLIERGVVEKTGGDTGFDDDYFIYRIRDEYNEYEVYRRKFEAKEAMKLRCLKKLSMSECRDTLECSGGTVECCGVERDWLNDAMRRSPSGVSIE